MWKVYAGDEAKKMYIDFNSSSSHGGRLNTSLGYWQYHDNTSRNIGHVSNYAIQAPSVFVNDWQQVQIGTQSLAFGYNPGWANGQNLSNELLRSVTLYNQEYKLDHDGIVAKVHGKLVVDGIVKSDPTAPASTSEIGQLLLAKFKYKNGGTHVVTPHQTLLARENQTVTSDDQLYRLVLGKKIPKLGTGWSSDIDGGALYDNSHPSINTLTQSNNMPLEQNYLLSVDGLAVFKSVLVMNAQAFRTWGDYVFDQPHPLSQLDTLEQYVNENKHLPGIPSATDIQANGLDMAKIVTEHNIKIEEIYLYLMELKKENEKLRQALKDLQK
jgi:hypothetical protein